MNASRSRTLATLLVLLACLGCSGRADESWARVQARGTLIVGMDPSFPPFEVDDGSGTIRGLDVELATRLASSLDLELALRPISYDGLYDALAAGEVDLLISALAIDSARTQDVWYSEPYFLDGFVLAGPPGFSASATYAGEIAVEAGSAAGVHARAQWPAAHTLERPSEADALRATLDGRPACVGRVAACWAAESLPLELGIVLDAVPLAVAGRHNGRELTRRVAETLEVIYESDEWADAKGEWLGEACR